MAFIDGDVLQPGVFLSSPFCLLGSILKFASVILIGRCDSFMPCHEAHQPDTAKDDSTVLTKLPSILISSVVSLLKCHINACTLDMNLSGCSAFIIIATLV